MKSFQIPSPTSKIFGTPLPRRYNLFGVGCRICYAEISANKNTPLSKGVVARKFERKNLESLFQKSLTLKDFFFGNARNNGNFFFRIISRKHGIDHFETSLYFGSSQAAVNFFLCNHFFLHDLQSFVFIASLQSFDFVDGKSCLCRDYIQRNFGVTEPLGHGLLLFQRFGLCLFKALLLAFMKFVFQSHILVPRESVGFEIRHLFVDGFGFVRVHVLGCKVLHVGLYDRVVKLLIPRKNIKIFISEVVQANVCVLFSPVFKVVNRKSIAKLPTGYKRLSYSRQKMSNIVCSYQHLNNLFDYSKAA